MKVLVYGAGVIGCFLAHTLCEAGQEVTLLARGAWRKALETNGLVIRHSLQKKNTVNHPRIVEEAGDEQYDAAFAVMQHQQMAEALPKLAEIHTTLLICVGNNMSASWMEREILSRAKQAEQAKQAKQEKKVLFGFQGTGGRRENGRVECVRFGDGSMSLGGLHGEVDVETKERVGAMFQGTKYRLTWVSDMDAWYRCHLTLMLPACYVCYAIGCNLRKASRKQRKMLLDAAGEAYGLLKELGYSIYPEGEDAYYQPGLKRTLMAAMVFVMAKTKVGELAASDHCRHAITEMEGLDAAWVDMRQRKMEFPMPAWDELRKEMPAWSAIHQTYGE